jgi:hypothetical protein
MLAAHLALSLAGKARITLPKLQRMAALRQ